MSKNGWFAARPSGTEEIYKIYAESFRPEILQLFEETKSIIFEAHPSIEKGGCIIESNFGTVDARIEKLNDQIDKILNLAPPAPENIET